MRAAFVAERRTVGRARAARVHLQRLSTVSSPAAGRPNRPCPRVLRPLSRAFRVQEEHLLQGPARRDPRRSLVAVRARHSSAAGCRQADYRALPVPPVGYTRRPDLRAYARSEPQGVAICSPPCFARSPGGSTTSIAKRSWRSNASMASPMSWWTHRRASATACRRVGTSPDQARDRAPSLTQRRDVKRQGSALAMSQVAVCCCMRHNGPIRIDLARLMAGDLGGTRMMTTLQHLLPVPLRARQRHSAPLR